MLKKIEYFCDCGVDYGSCDVKCSVILKSQKSCDSYTLYYTDGHDDEKPKTHLGVPECFGSNYLSSLSDVINLQSSNEQTLTEEEMEIVFGNSN